MKSQLFDKISRARGAMRISAYTLAILSAEGDKQARVLIECANQLFFGAFVAAIVHNGDLIGIEVCAENGQRLLTEYHEET